MVKSPQIFGHDNRDVNALPDIIAMLSYELIYLASLRRLLVIVNVWCGNENLSAAD